MYTYEKIIKYVDDSFQGKQKQHFERTVYWFEQFLPYCTEYHKIAAYAHDLERAFRDETTTVPKDYLDKDFLRHHQEHGAELVATFLKQENFAAEDIEKVSHLISRHEEGGDTEQDALMNADSVSFFETTAKMFATKKVSTEGYAKIKLKLDWMFSRITTEEAQAAAYENYTKWSTELEKYK